MNLDVLVLVILSVFVLNVSSPLPFIGMRNTSPFTDNSSTTFLDPVMMLFSALSSYVSSPQHQVEAGLDLKPPHILKIDVFLEGTFLLC